MMFCSSETIQLLSLSTAVKEKTVPNQLPCTNCHWCPTQLIESPWTPNATNHHLKLRQEPYAGMDMMMMPLV
eukprot:9268667-Karenia_brevis.AAC.1